jgi:hypothetical protein
MMYSSTGKPSFSRSFDCRKDLCVVTRHDEREASIFPYPNVQAAAAAISEPVSTWKEETIDFRSVALDPQALPRYRPFQLLTTAVLRSSTNARPT